MSIIKGEWIEITNIVAQIERDKEAKRIPSHPRTEMLEADMLRAIRILNDSGFTVVKELERDRPSLDKQKAIITMVAEIPQGLEKEALTQLFTSIRWYGEKLVHSKDFSVTLLNS